MENSKTLRPGLKKFKTGSGFFISIKWKNLYRLSKKAKVGKYLFVNVFYLNIRFIRIFNHFSK